MYRTDFWILWEKARVGFSEKIALKQVYCQGWNRPPAQVGCMRQVFRAGALGRPRGIGWGGRREEESGWGTHANPWLIHVNVWQKPLQYCKVISLQLIKINEKNKTNKPQEFFCQPDNWAVTLSFLLSDQRASSFPSESRDYERIKGHAADSFGWYFSKLLRNPKTSCKFL